MATGRGRRRRRLFRMRYLMPAFFFDGPQLRLWSSRRRGVA